MAYRHANTTLRAGIEIRISSVWDRLAACKYCAALGSAVSAVATFVPYCAAWTTVNAGPLVVSGHILL